MIVSANDSYITTEWNHLKEESSDAVCKNSGCDVSFNAGFNAMLN